MQHCFHCGLPVPEDCDYQVSVLGEPRDMCCIGCKSVAQAIVDGGLESFYEHRTAPSRKVEDLVPEELRQMELYDQPRLQQSFVEVDDDSVRSAALILEGITCAACVWLNERHVGSLPGVLDFNVNYSTHRARVRWDDSHIHLSDILRAITDIGYVAHPFDPGRQEEVFRKERSIALRRLAVAGLGTMQVMMLAVPLYGGAEGDMLRFLRWISMILTSGVVLYSARTFFITAWRDLKRRQVSMDVPVSLAIGGAFAASIWSTSTGSGEVYFESVCMFTFFLLTSRFLEMGARHRAGHAAESLVKMLPATATRINADGGHEAVAVADLAPGDKVLVKPGDTVPVDGSVIEGASSVDESLLTGESLPRAREMGAELIGGSVNVESPLVMRVDKVGEDTVVSAIVRLLDRAQAEKPAIARLADRIAGWFIAVLLLLATAVAIWWGMHDPERAFVITLSVLVVTCPCALSLATPAAVTAATGALTKQGLLITRGHALESLAKATHIVFDKTGTLTHGRLKLEQVIPLGAMTEERALQIAAALESRSEHPVGKLLVKAAVQPSEATELTSKPGHGVEGLVSGRRYRIGSVRYVEEMCGDVAEHQIGCSTRIALADETGVLAWFELSDTLRNDAVEGIDELRQLGLEVRILSGDVPDAVASVASALAIDNYHGNLRPEDKLEHVRALQQQGGVVVMVGDGVNDAPVLAGSQVSLAVGGGTRLAHASADMILLSERLGNIAEGVRTSRRTVSIIRQNLSWAIFYNIAAVPLAAAGYIVPWMAALGMSLSSLVVVLNALRLKSTKES